MTRKALLPTTRAGRMVVRTQRRRRTWRFPCARLRGWDSSTTSSRSRTSRRRSNVSFCLSLLHINIEQCDFLIAIIFIPVVADIRRSNRPFLEDKTEDDFFQIDVRVCSGKPMTIVASRKGFYPAGKRLLLCHSLVSVLQQISRVFDAVSLFLNCIHISFCISLNYILIMFYQIIYFACRPTRLL